MHRVLVKMRSTRMVVTTGPAAPSPKSATSRGTPMKPVLGKAATSAPNAAFFRSTPSPPGLSFRVSATVRPMIKRAHRA